MSGKTSKPWVMWALLSKAVEIAVLLGFHYGIGIGWGASIVATVAISFVLMTIGWVMAKRGL